MNKHNKVRLIWFWGILVMSIISLIHTDHLGYSATYSPDSITVAWIGRWQCNLDGRPAVLELQLEDLHADLRNDLRRVIPGGTLGGRNLVIMVAGGCEFHVGHLPPMTHLLLSKNIYCRCVSTGITVIGC